MCANVMIACASKHFLICLCGNNRLLFSFGESLKTFPLFLITEIAIMIMQNLDQFMFNQPRNELSKYSESENDQALRFHEIERPFGFGITIMDNDFTYSTLLPFVELLMMRLRRGVPTKDQIVELFNRSATGIYWVAQNQLQYETEWDAASYLRDPNVYMGEELNQKFETVDSWANGDMVVFYLPEYLPPQLFIV
mgnify:CR=1 FL=1